MKFPFPRYVYEHDLDTKERDRLKRAYINTCTRIGQRKKGKQLDRQ